MKNMVPSPQWENPDAFEYLTELGGSKSGATAYLADTCPELHPQLPKGAYLEPWEDADDFLDEKVDLREGKVVVRGCHSRDVYGMVDVLETLVVPSDGQMSLSERLTRDREARRVCRERVERTPTDIKALRKELREAILRIRDQAHAEDVRGYVEYESGAPFDGQIGILAQDCCGDVRGSVVEHPNEKGGFRISISTPSYSTHNPWDVEESAFVDSGLCVSAGKPGSGRMGFDPDTIKQIIGLYRTVRDTGIMPASYSFQMEFGLPEVDGRSGTKRRLSSGGEHLPVFYQARLFRPYQGRADFTIDEIIRKTKKEGSFVTSNYYDSFGITPPEGITLRLAELDEEFIEKFQGVDHIAYAHNLFNQSHHGAPLSIRPRNMEAYIPYSSKLLEHGYFRWMQKAAVTTPLGTRLSQGRLRRKGLDPVSLSDQIIRINENPKWDLRVQVICDGIRSAVRVIE
jgi:hypothetical protein